MSARRRNSTVESQPSIGSKQQRFARSESSEKPRGRALAIFGGSHAWNRRCVAPQIRPIPIRRLGGGSVEEYRRGNAAPVNSHNPRQLANGRMGTGASWMRKYQQGRAAP